VSVFTESASAARVLLYAKHGCHLCDEAREIIREVCDQAEVEWREVDIGADPQLLARYGEQLPVTFVDGRQHDFWRVDPARLRAALGAPR